jgi:cbb3-type cytochrome oxidase subunit 1
VDIKALTINEALSAGLPIARDLLGSVDSYCLYEGGNEVVIEYWRGNELSVKLIYTNDPAKALMHYYNAEKAGLVRCSSVS